MSQASRFSIYNNLERYRSDKKLQDYTHITLTLAAVAVFLLFAIRPTIVIAISLYRDIQDLKEVEENTSTRIEIINEIRQDEEQFTTIKELIEKAAPATPEEGLFISQLYQTASKYGVQIERISFSEQPADSGLSRMQFNIEANANYDRLIAYIDDLNNHLRIINIHSISVRPGGFGNLVIFNISGVTFFSRDSQ